MVFVRRGAADGSR